jgi:uncharacterized protein YcbK (DUF882 family)
MILPPLNTPDILLPSRRRFLQSMASTVASLALPCFGQTSDFWLAPRELWLYRPATRETVREVYWANGEMVPEGYYKICQLLRDTHMNIAVQMDIVTLDIVRGVYGWINSFGIDRPIIINSGYRHPKTNASEGGVRNSLHTLGQALDIRIEGVSAESVTAFGKYLAGGGVGFYPGKHFTHLDRGRIRYWKG